MGGQPAFPQKKQSTLKPDGLFRIMAGDDQADALEGQFPQKTFESGDECGAEPTDRPIQQQPDNHGRERQQGIEQGNSDSSAGKPAQGDTCP